MTTYNRVNICQTCGKKAHNFEIEEVMNCIPPLDVLKFGPHLISSEYRQALYDEYPMYTTEEVVGSYLGHNPNFPSEDEWYEEENELYNEEE